MRKYVVTCDKCKTTCLKNTHASLTVNNIHPFDLCETCFGKFAQWIGMEKQKKEKSDGSV